MSGGLADVGRENRRLGELSDDGAACEERRVSYDKAGADDGSSGHADRLESVDQAGKSHAEQHGQPQHEKRRGAISGPKGQTRSGLGHEGLGQAAESRRVCERIGPDRQNEPDDHQCHEKDPVLPADESRTQDGQPW